MGPQNCGRCRLVVFISGLTVCRNSIRNKRPFLSLKSIVKFQKICFCETHEKYLIFNNHSNIFTRPNCFLRATIHFPHTFLLFVTPSKVPNQFFLSLSPLWFRQCSSAQLSHMTRRRERNSAASIRASQEMVHTRRHISLSAFFAFFRKEFQKTRK